MLIAFYSTLLAISIIAATILVLILLKSIRTMIEYLAPSGVSNVWVRVIVVAIYFLALGGGLEINRLIGIGANDLTLNRWMMEIINTLIQAFMAPISMLLFLFTVFLIATGIIKAIERSKRREAARTKKLASTTPKNSKKAAK
jgi:hypothetical protein